MEILRAADRVAVPWKNGGGVTREVAAQPAGAGFDAFDWRVSMAEVAESGPFSVFPGIERWLLVLDGRMRLDVEGLGAFELGPGDHLAFPGDAPTHGEVLAGPVLDLNVMTRRGRLSARMERLDGGPVGGAPQLAVALGPARIGACALSTYDAVRLAPGDPPASAEGPMLLATFF